MSRDAGPKIFGGYSPLRAKRRQSDAKWRASVATCYDALKYVVPNVKHMSKRKISKALILQECEKHIRDLENAIKHILNNEYENKGKAVLWKEGVCWSHCTLEKFHADFADKQRRVFHTSAHGRRCYNLLQDIKEEVFSMKADPRKIAFVTEFAEDKGYLHCKTDSTDTCENISVSSFVAESTNICKKNTQATTSMINELKCHQRNTSSVNKKKKSLPGFPLIYLRNREDLQVKQERQQKLASMMSWSDNRSNCSNEMMSVSLACLPKQTQLSNKSLAEDESQTVLMLIPSSTSVSSPTSAFSSSVSSTSAATLSFVWHDDLRSIITSSVPDGKVDMTNSFSKNEENTIDVKLENVENHMYISSNKEDCSYLLNALQSEKEQVVPYLKTPNKTVQIKRPRLASRNSESESLSDFCDINELKVRKDGRECAESLKSTTVNKGSYVRKNAASTCSTNSLDSDTDALNTTVYLTDIKSETDGLSIPSTKYDPVLSSLNTQGPEMSTPLFHCSDNGPILKRPQKFCSARKKLNFGSQSNIPLLSPNRSSLLSPVMSGFTPIKLPQDFTQNNDSDDPTCTLASPWKIFSFPYDCRPVSQMQNDLDSSSVTDLENSLLCLETLDSIDLDDGLCHEKTPAQPSGVEKAQHITEETTKEKISPIPYCQVSRTQPKCRKRLERFYDQGEGILSTCESQVVPQAGCDMSTKEINEILGVPAHFFSPVKDSDFKEGSDFDGFYFYYHQVCQRLKEKLGPHEMQSPTIAAKVAHMWSRLPQQDKVTMATLANLECHQNKSDNINCGKLSPDLEDVNVEPLDSQGLIPNFV